MIKKSFFAAPRDVCNNNRNMSTVDKAMIRRRNGLVREVSKFKSTFGDQVAIRYSEEESDANGVTILARVEESETNAQILFKLQFKMSLTFEAPVISFLTKNHVFETGKPVCIDGITHYHPESYSKATRLEEIVDGAAQYLLIEEIRKDIAHGLGIHESIEMGHPPDTVEYNQKYNAKYIKCFE